uniref:Pentatricopeptide repeat-containing protein At1g16830 n=1 Tax=Elaeis guineensis var. tenera TaxID=51953 RepID=A0A6J0PHF1_ELAGV|nr:putative pentatricopeptide repeat-containing protein At1g16830 [Elaeis guineensis]XP_019705814.1 putative pentatricopeptide repeat-containing protein At1g16830 [Elaeis guineensis]XP_019705815.1 putative pentatricopeptide repeat-containing protein At1g16830 [Elaeis guineensis]XP_029120038.1 putative pentatricopeptide repeat-containing protein At1g16830 [Elaeis guineensis]
MKLRWRRLLHLSSNWTFKTLRNPSNKCLDGSQLHLCPQVVESTVWSCPSDTIALSFFLWCARQPNYFHDPRSFDRMIPIAGRLTERFGSVAAIVEELESIGCSVKAQTFMILLRIYWRGNLYRLALEVFDEMSSRNFVPNTFARNMVLDILFKVGHFGAAMRFLRDIEFPNFLSYNIVVCNLCKSRDWLRVRDVLREMVKKGFHPNTGTYTMVLDCFHKAGRLMESLQLLAFMIVSGNRPNIAIWTILIDSLCRTGKVDLASRLFGKMIESGCSPSVVTYTSLIKGFFEARMYKEVLRMLDSMLSSGCNPDLVLYNVLIDCLSKVQKYDDAIDVFLLLRESKLKPDSYTLSSLLSAICSSGKMSLLPKLVTGLHVSIDLVACNSLLNFFCKVGHPSQAVDFYSDMVERGFAPDKYSYVGLLNGLCRLGKIDYAINFYHAIVENDPHIDAYFHTVILDGLTKRGKYHWAIRLFRKAVKENYCLDVVSYTIALHGLFKGGRFQEACSLFDQMKQFGVIPNACTYNVMLLGLCRARDIDAVKQLLRDMEIAGIEMDYVAYNTIIAFLIKLRRFNSAFLVFSKMCDLGMKPNKTTYSLLSKGLGHVSAEGLDNQYSQLTYNLEDTDFVYSTESDQPNELLVSSGS